MRHRKEGGVSLRASINGRTGINSSDGFCLGLWGSLFLHAAGATDAQHPY